MKKCSMRPPQLNLSEFMSELIWNWSLNCRSRGNIEFVSLIHGLKTFIPLICYKFRITLWMRMTCVLYISFFWYINQLFISLYRISKQGKLFASSVWTKRCRGNCFSNKHNIRSLTKANYKNVQIKVAFKLMKPSLLGAHMHIKGNNGIIH